MNKGFASGFISSEIKGEDVNTKNGDMRKIKFSIACNRKVKGEADFPWFEAIGKTAETIEKYLSKGKGISVEYHIQTGKYTNKDGKTIYTSTNMIDSFEFPPIRRDEIQENNEESVSQNESSDGRPSAPDEFMDIPSEDIESLPFRK